MRPSRFTLAAVLIAGLAGLAAFAVRPPANAQDDEAARAKAEAEALTKAVERGKELFHSKELGRKSCATCHEDPDKPQDDLRTAKFAYPKYSRRKKAVVTLQQKINEMIKYKARGKELEGDSTDLAAIAAYVESIRTR